MSGEPPEWMLWAMFGLMAFIMLIPLLKVDPPIHIRPNLPAHCGCRGKEPCGFSHFGVVIIPPRVFDRHQILLATRAQLRS